MGLIEADFWKFEESERCFRQALHSMEEILTRLEHQLNVHLDEWDGDDRRAYQAAADSWHRAAREIARKIDDLHRRIQVAHRNFRAAHAANQRMWTPL
ncbi:WXG100 family type VII secretion target [Actinomadura opuntiae]|uniref:WXG100 family type VII secretion target n=1 Tax=Actinomadura sp. OS1-43 TaxID=604315 RepID=UPI00255B0D25|nr:WXG100 family type VII secretion target [Actinomadura sp. OS1-43]MDL4814172.1 WXG100 family type VII secretion target [Actinomadura sp. OS1-43]